MNSLPNKYLLLIIILLSGCAKDTLIQNATQSWINSDSDTKNENLDILVLQFKPEDCDVWFCESKMIERVFKGVEKAITLIGGKRPNITRVNTINTGDELNGFYEKLSSIDTESDRHLFLDSFAKSHNSTVLFFGVYEGDDYEMMLRQYMYYSNNSHLYKPKHRSKYTRHMPEEELIEKIYRDLTGLLDNIEEHKKTSKPCK